MFRLSKYVRREQLNEAFDNLQSVSEEVIKQLKRHCKSDLGHKSTVQLLPYSKASIDKIFDYMSKREGLIVVIRYKNEDLAIIYNDGSRWRSSEYSVQTLSDLEAMGDSWTDKPEFTKIKSQSGFVKNCKAPVAWLAEKFNIPSKEITKKMTFQIILVDPDRATTANDRKNIKMANSNYVNKNGHSAISNYGMKNLSLSARLKQFIENKMPNITDPNNLPKDLLQIKPDTQFKFLDLVFKFYGYQGDFDDIMKGKPVYIKFECPHPFKQYVMRDLDLYFEIVREGVELKVRDIKIGFYRAKNKLDVDEFAKVYSNNKEDGINLLDNNY